MPEKLFNIEVAAGYDFNKEEIWVDGDAPENPTVEDVVEEIKKYSPGANTFITDWGFDPQVYVDGKLVEW